MDLLSNDRWRSTWIEIFEKHTRGVEKLAVESEGGGEDAKRRAAAFARRFHGLLADYRRDPVAHGEPSVMRFCGLRQQCLREQGIADPYLSIKRRENEAALRLLPGLLQEIDATAMETRWRRLVENAFAGNIFDLGCAGTIAMYESGQADFHTVRARLPHRPWCLDDLDAFERRMSQTVHRKAVVFVDNAGADVVLGMIPFTRELLRRGTAVILTANTLPALNDITHEELVGLMGRVAQADRAIAQSLRDERLTLIASGNDIPLIDLSRVSGELAQASRDADLLVIEGMGRALESNFRTRFTADTLKIAMVKEPVVAEAVGAKLYGVACRFEPGK